MRSNGAPNFFNYEKNPFYNGLFGFSFNKLYP